MRDERKKKRRDTYFPRFSLVFYLLAIWHTVRQPNTSFNKIKSQFHELSSVMHRAQHEHGPHKLSRSDEHFMKFLPIDWVYWWWVFSLPLPLLLLRHRFLVRLFHRIFISIAYNIHKCYRERFMCAHIFRLIRFTWLYVSRVRWIFRRVSHIRSVVLYHHYAPFFPISIVARSRFVASCRKSSIFVERKIFHITRH